MGANKAAPCVTLSQMKEKPLSPQTKRAPDRVARGEEKPQKNPRRETRKRIREIAERHQETLDYLAEH
jgi:hypothetical protein